MSLADPSRLVSSRLVSSVGNVSWFCPPKGHRIFAREPGRFRFALFANFEFILILMQLYPSM